MVALNRSQWSTTGESTAAINRLLGRAGYRASHCRFPSGAILVSELQASARRVVDPVGERFAARPHVQMPSVSPALQTAGPPAQLVPAPKAEPPVPQKMASTSPTVLPPPKSIPLPLSKKLMPEPLTRPANRQVAQILTETPISTTSAVADIAAPKASAAAAAEAISTTAFTIPLRAVPFALDSNVIPAKSGPLHQLEPGNGNHIQNGGEGNFGSSSQMYFEVGKFKEESLAYRTTDKLARLGFRATVVEKGIFGRIPTTYLWAPTTMMKEPKQYARNWRRAVSSHESLKGDRAPSLFTVGATP